MLFIPLNNVHLSSNYWKFGVGRQSGEHLIFLCKVLFQLLPVDRVYASDD